LIIVTLPQISANVGADREIKKVKTDDIENNKQEIDDNKPMTASLESKVIAYNDVKTEDNEENITKDNESKEQASLEDNVSNMIASRGGNVIDFSKVKRVEFHTSVYSNINTRMEGGQYDKNGKRLTSHDVPVVALPKDVPYGSLVIFDEAIFGETCYTNVDSGSAIKWLNSDKTRCKVDIFIPDATQKELLKYDNKVVYGWLYYK
jgi:hypothetical protein